MKHATLERHLMHLRDPATRPPEFRRNLRSIGEILGYEIARGMPTVRRNITVALGGPQFMDVLEQEPALIYVERAGRELYFGLQEAFQSAESGVIGASRDEETLKSTIGYAALPRIEGKEVIVADTMIATGGSMMQALDLVKEHDPKKIHVVGAIASRHAMRVLYDYDRDVQIHVAAIDPELDRNGFIRPGLGDAGDRCYGIKQ